MNAVDRDDFVHALGQTLAFYGKDLDRMQTSFWVTACGGRTVNTLKLALLEYVKTGKYAPKPADILGIADGMRQQSRTALPPPEKKSRQCPPDIAKAWMWFLGRIADGSQNFSGLFSDSGPVPADVQERYLHIVNHEAHKYGTPESIPDEYKLPEVWGN